MSGARSKSARMAGADGVSRPSNASSPPKSLPVLPLQRPVSNISCARREPRVTETAKYWGSVCTTFLGSGLIAAALLGYEIHSRRAQEMQIAEFAANEARAKAIDAFGSSIYGSSEAAYRMMLAYQAWNDAVDQLDPAAIDMLMSFVTASNAQRLIEGEVALPEDIGVDAHAARLYAQYLLRRVEYARCPSAQALCVGLQSRLVSGEAHASVDRLRGAFANLENRSECECSDRAPHDAESTDCIHHLQNKVARHVDETLESISKEVVAPFAR